MNKIENKRKNIFIIIQSIILQYCPLVEDRLYFLDDARKNKELDIEISFSNNKTNIGFLIGTNSFKQSIKENINIGYYIDFFEIKDLIDFIIQDHKIITSFEMNEKNVFSMKFSINWTNAAIRGLNCNKTRISFNFNDNIDLRNFYLISLFENYHDQLEKLPCFIQLKNNYIDKIKISYFDSLNKDQLVDFIVNLSEGEIKELLFNLNNDIFLKLSNNHENEQSPKKLTLKRNN